ncbi:MAG: hypothetical protein JW818_16840 [Pirellulales bacterium]|nr:hypothetical protein [Pirellulales bacterium]
MCEECCSADQEHPHDHDHDHGSGPADRVRQEWDKAKQHCEDFRREANERLEKVRQTTLGDLMDGALEGVKRRPGLGLIAAAAAGFFLGRLFRR